ncbi:MAG: ATP-binding protein, partial [Saprospiraceae bacterium]
KYGRSGAFLFCFQSGSILEVICFSLGLGYKQLVNEKEKQKVKLALFLFYLIKEQEHAEAERLQELDQVKSRFYTNITHEFRTPLTIILGMLKQLKTGSWISKSSDKEQNRIQNGLNLVERNGQKLLQLINQILDLSKLDAQKIRPQYVTKEVIGFIQYLGESFESLAENKNIKLLIYSEVNQLEMDVDESKLQQILANLLSNAIKFTPRHGKVVLHLTRIDEQLVIKIKDSGIGIAAADLPHIFNRFYQIENNQQAQGTGIGLALVKELVAVLEGTIEVQSEIDAGTTFILKLPIRNTGIATPEVASTPTTIDPIQMPSQPLVRPLTESLDSLQQLLIVEDNLDVVLYIQSILQPHYQIQVAMDGQEGIEQAIAEIPDLIVSDVMMPRKDGFELVETLKNDERTNHIPIILLTAKATKMSKIEGLKKGADAYLMKPFEQEELFVRIEQMLQTRRQLQEKYTTAAQITNPKTAEAIFIEKVQNCLQAHYQNSEFTIPEWANLLQLSRQQFYRKLKALTNQTPVAYLRDYRLERAKELLLSGSNLNVSEVAYEVGFDNPSYFSRVFAAAYGKTPNQMNK